MCMPQTVSTSRGLLGACPQVLFGCLSPLPKVEGGTEWGGGGGGGVKSIVVSVCIMNFGAACKGTERGKFSQSRGITLTNL